MKEQGIQLEFKINENNQFVPEVPKLSLASIVEEVFIDTRRVPHGGGVRIEPNTKYEIVIGGKRRRRDTRRIKLVA